MWRLQELLIVESVHLYVTVHKLLEQFAWVFSFHELYDKITELKSNLGGKRREVCIP